MKNLSIYSIILLLSFSFTMQAQTDGQYQGLDKKASKNYKKAEDKKADENYKSALKLFLKVAESNPDHISSLRNIANIYKEMEKYSEAISFYNKAVSAVDKEINFCEESKTTKIGQKAIEIKINKFTVIKNGIEQKIEICKSKGGADNSVAETENQEDTDGKQPKKNADTEEDSTPGSSSDRQTSEIKEGFTDDGVDYDALFKTEFLDINPDYDDELKAKIIKEKVEKVYNQLKDDGKLTEYGYNDIQKINNGWLKQKAFTNFKWFSELKDYESKYLLRLQEYNEFKLTTKRLQEDRSILLNDIRGLESKIDFAEQNRQRNFVILERNLEEELSSKLATIPRSIILVGRIELLDKSGVGGNEKEIRANYVKDLTRIMQQEAVKYTQGYDIKSTSLIEDESLRKKFEKTTQGTAQTADLYYKDLTKTFLDDDKKYIYQILRIEVYPYKDGNQMQKDTKSATGIDVSSDEHFDVYKYDKATEELIHLRSKKRSLYKEHMFEDQEKVYLKFQTDFSNTLNQKYQEVIERALMDYKTKRDTLSNRNILLLKNIKELEKEKLTKDEKFQEIETKLRRSSKISDTKYEDYRKAFKDYENYYKTKVTYTNKLNVQSEASKAVSRLAHFKLLVDKSLDALDDVKKNATKITVYKEVSADKSNVNSEETTISFKPNLVGYRILSMGRYLDGQEVYVALNIAYKIRWEAEELTGEEIANALKERKKQAEEISKKVNPNNTSGGSIFISGNTATIPDISGSISFKFVNKATSKLNSADVIEYGWRLPKPSELESIFKTAKENIGTDKDYLMKAFDWPSEASEIEFLTDKTEMDYSTYEEVSQTYRVKKSNYSFEDSQVTEDEEVYIILVKK